MEHDSNTMQIQKGCDSIRSDLMAIKMQRNKIEIWREQKGTECFDINRNEPSHHYFSRRMVSFFLRFILHLSHGVVCHSNMPIDLIYIRHSFHTKQFHVQSKLSLHRNTECCDRNMRVIRNERTSRFSYFSTDSKRKCVCRKT